MKPAVCMICGKSIVDEVAPNKGDWIKFFDYCPLLPDSHGHFPPGHPHGLEYFCDKHVVAAKLLTSMSSAEALATLKKQFGDIPQYKKPPPPPPPWWWRLFSK